MGTFRYDIIRRDLAAARSGGTAEQISIPYHKLFVLEAPAPFTLRIGQSSAPPFPVSRAGDIPTCGADTIGDVWLENAAGTGEVVLLATDDLDPNFPAGGAEAAAIEQLYAALVPTAADGVADYTKLISAATEATVANYGLFEDLPKAFRGMRLFANASGVLDIAGELYRGNHTHLELANRHAPGGTAKVWKSQATMFMRLPGILLERQGTAPSANEWCTIGYWARNTGTPGIRYSHGVGFATSHRLSDNWFAAVIDSDATGAAFDWPAAADRIIWVDTGVSSIDQFHALELRSGVSGSLPFIEWIVDGVVKHRHAGAFAWMLTMGPIGGVPHEVLRVFRQASTAVDFLRAYIVPPVYLGFAA